MYYTSDSSYSTVHITELQLQLPSAPSVVTFRCGYRLRSVQFSSFVRRPFRRLCPSACLPFTYRADQIRAKHNARCCPPPPASIPLLLLRCAVGCSDCSAAHCISSPLLFVSVRFGAVRVSRRVASCDRPLVSDNGWKLQQHRTRLLYSAVHLQHTAHPECADTSNSEHSYRTCE